MFNLNFKYESDDKAYTERLVTVKLARNNHQTLEVTSYHQLHHTSYLLYPPSRPSLHYSEAPDEIHGVLCDQERLSENQDFRRYLGQAIVIL